MTPESPSPSRIERWRWFILIAFLAIGPFVVVGARLANESSNNSIEQWLPEEFEESRIHKWFLSHFGSDEFVLVTWKNCTLDDERLPRFAEAARLHLVPEDKQTAAAEENQLLFSSVSTGAEMLEQLLNPRLKLTRQQALERLYGITVGKGEEITGTIIVFSDKGDENRVGTIDVLRSIAVDEIGIPAEDLHMVGDAVTNAAVDQASKDAVQGLLGLCGIVALVMAIVSLRSIRLLIVVFVVSGYCYVLAQSAVYYIDFSDFSSFFGGKMNLVLVVMPVLVYVLAMSAGVHLVNYYREAAAEQGTILGAPIQAIRHGWVPCTLAAGTTAVGVGSLAVSNIRPVKDFGTYSALGILASLAVLFLLLPALLTILDRAWIKLRGGKLPDWPRRKQESDSPSRPWIDNISSVFIKHHATTSTVCIIILALFAWGACYIQTDLKPRRFFEPDHQLNIDYDWLTEAIGPQVPIEIVVRFDTDKSQLSLLQQLEMVSKIEQDVRDADEINMTLSATTFFIPLETIPAATDSTNIARSQRDVIDEKLADNLSHLEEALVVSRHQNKNLWRISCRSRGLKDSEGYDEFNDAVESRVNQHLLELGEWHDKKLKQVETADRQVRENIETKYAAARKDHADDPAKLKTAKLQYDLDIEDADRNLATILEVLKDPTVGVKTEVTGMVPLFFAAQRELLDSLIESFGTAFLLIAILMIVLLRSFRAGMISMLPNVFPVVVIFGAMGWSGRFVDIGSMMTASVAMGIAVDDTVHFLTWFRRGMHEGMTRHEAVTNAYRRCALAMTQTTAIAGLSLLVFGLSPFQPVSQFGILMFVLLIGALIGDLIFLPALLAGPAGRLFEEKHNESNGKPLQPDPQPIEA